MTTKNSDLVQAIDQVLDERSLTWAARWIEDSLRGETNERVIEFGQNMAMTLRAARIQDTRVPVDRVAPVVDLDEGETFANTHFQFGFCVHSMMKPNCPGCLQGHASRLEKQLRKLEASTALPIRERIERVLREHLTHWQEHYRGVPPTVEGWINNALHSIMWGIDRDLPLPAAAPPAPKKEEAHRCPHCGRRMIGDFDEDVGIWYECANCDYREAVSSTVTAAKPSGAAREAADRPRIICLCGSTRFIEQFAIKTWELERQGFIVLGCTLLPMWYCNVPSHFGEVTGTKEQCDELHKRKIDLADEILVLNIGGYIGESTANEIEYATRLGKPVQYLEGVTAPTAPVVSDGDPEG